MKGEKKMDKLAVLNELEVIDSSCSNGTCEYVLIEKTEENLETLKELGADMEDIENMKVLNDDSVLDITWFAFNQLDAAWYQPGNGFSYEEY